MGSYFCAAANCPAQWADHAIIDTDYGAIIGWSNFNTSLNQSEALSSVLRAVYPDWSDNQLN
jgi:hypothetical protein